MPLALTSGHCSVRAEVDVDAELSDLRAQLAAKQAEAEQTPTGGARPVVVEGQVGNALLSAQTVTSQLSEQGVKHRGFSGASH